MPRIKDILRDHILSADDRLLGTDISGVTRNYKLSDIASFGNLGATGFAGCLGALGFANLRFFNALVVAAR